MTVSHVVAGKDVFNVLSLVNEQCASCYVVSNMYTEDPGGQAKIRDFEM